MTLKIKGGQCLSGTITPSGSKNSAVCLIPATILFDKPVTLTNIPEITDVSRLVEILTHMGSKITWDKTAKSMTLDNSRLNFESIDQSDVSTTKGIRGTTLLWGPLLARFKKCESSEQPAGCTLGARPLDAHFQAFFDLGVTVKTENNHITLDSSRAKPATVWLLETSVTATENVVMLATSLSGTTTIINAATEPHVQDLCNFLNACGANITGIGSSILTIHPSEALREGGQPTTYNVVSDHYEIGTFLALGAITHGEIRVKNAIPEHFLTINREFAKFGIQIQYDGDTAIDPGNQTPVITRTSSPLIVRAQPWPGLPVDMLPLFIPLALASPGTHQVLFHNWMYESGLYWSSELLKFGANVTMCDPHRILTTGGNKLHGAQIEAPYIIRAAIALVMTAMIAEGESVIIHASSINRGHPDFVKNLRSLGAQIEEIN
jgi:UDP-N-acetylglucosamine 1-carboxyvinyltransferase